MGKVPLFSKAVVLTPVLALALTAASACNDSPTEPDFPDQSGVPYSQQDLEVGSGAEAAVGKTVSVHYALWLYSESAADHKGTPIQTTVGGPPFSTVISNDAVIQGWVQGVPGMRVGGVRRLILPPSLAYGPTGNVGIPPNAALVFEIQLLGVQ